MKRNTVKWKMIVVPGIILGIFVSVFIFSSLYNVSIMRSQLIKSDTDMLQIVRENIDEKLELISKILVLTAVQDSYMEQLDLLQEDTLTEMDKVDQYYAMHMLQEEIRTHKKNFSYLDGIAGFSSFSNRITGVYGSLPKETIEKFAWNICKNDSILDYQKKWNAVKFDKEYYLVTVRSDGTKHAMAWIKIKNLLDIEKHEMDSVHGIYIQNETGNLLGERKYSEQFNALKCLEGKSNNIILSEKLKNARATLSLETASDDIFAGVTEIQIVLLLIAFGCMGIIPLLHRVLNRNVMEPIDELVSSMNAFENGNIEAHIDVNDETREFEKLGNSFNSMVEQIKNLKIKVYEDELLRRDIELQYLKTQIKPHFLMNTLNVIYSFLLTGAYDMAQKAIMCLIKYCRTILKDNIGVVSLKEEIKHLENYLEIMEMRFATHFTYIIEIEPGLETLKIPSLMLQTFVENCIKYAGDDQYNFEILIQIEKSKKEKNSVIVLISDTGKGFEEEKLEQLNRFGTGGEGHIGIGNIQKRLYLLYGERAGMHFFNRKEGGACVKVVFPMEMEESR